MSELVEDGVTGLQFAPGNAGDLDRALKRFIDNPDFAGRMGQATRQRYLERFTPDRILSGLEAVYQSIA
jgi:glycogen(starch) synthase